MSGIGRSSLAALVATSKEPPVVLNARTEEDRPIWAVA